MGMSKQPWLFATLILPLFRALVESSGNQCRTLPQWRYSSREARHTDVATASYQPDFAWYAISSGSTVPYRFSTRTPDMDHQFLQIDFLAPSRVVAIQTVGRSGSNKAVKGMVSVFKLAYKNFDGKWKYYTDSKGATELFTVASRKDADESSPATFKLPTALLAEGIRIYVQKFSDMPFLALDLKACYLKSALEISDCTRSLMNSASRPVPVAFRDLRSRVKNGNFRRYNTLTLSEDEARLVTELVVSPPQRGGRVKSFVLQYLDSSLNWKNIVDKDGIIKIFRPGVRRGKLYVLLLPLPVKTRVLRLFPEEWETSKPKILVDVRGCLPHAMPNKD